MTALPGESTMGGDLRYELLCPIGRKTEARHHHGSNKDTHFYHEEKMAFGSVTVMFTRVELDDERILVYPLTVNVSSLGPSSMWEKASPIEPTGVSSRIAALLKEGRMILREVGKSEAAALSTKLKRVGEK